MKQSETSFHPELHSWVLESDFDQLSPAAQAQVRQHWSEAAYRAYRRSMAQQAAWLQSQPLPSPPPALQQRLRWRLQRRRLLGTQSSRLSAYPMAAAVALLFAAAFFGLRSGPVLSDSPSPAPVIVDSTMTDSAQQRHLPSSEDTALSLSFPSRL